MTGAEDPFDQRGHRLRFDWGLDGLRRLAPSSGAVVVVDVLRFTTCVDVAVDRGGVVLPYRWRDAGAEAFAAEHGAELAGRREDPATPWSLSPTDLGGLPPGTRLVLPSPNGSALSFAALDCGARRVLAGCLRNASAVARALRDEPAVAVIASGELAGEGSVPRPAVEDLLGAGAVLAAAGPPGDASPEARAAVAAFRAAADDDLHGWLRASASGRELITRWAYDDDVATAAAHDVSDAVPELVDGAYVGNR